MTEAVDIATGEIVPLPRGPVAVRQSVAELAAQAEEIREMVAAVLKEGTDYGVIPGTNKPSLLKSGAEWLLKWAGYGHRMDPVEVERDETGAKFGVTYRCTVMLLGQPEAIVSTCDGYAGYDEDRFYQSVVAQEARERANAVRYSRMPNPAKWAEPYRAPWNSVLKMSEKRALVGAALQATATSGLFTQDMEDMTPRGAAADWFTANGWDGQAAYDAAVATLLDRIKALTEEQRVTLRTWMGAEGLTFTRSLTLTEVSRINARVDEMAPPPEPFDGAPPDPMQEIVDRVAAMKPGEVSEALTERGLEVPENRRRAALALTDALWAEAGGSALGVTRPSDSAEGSTSPPEGTEPEAGMLGPEGVQGSAEGDVLDEVIEHVKGMPPPEVVAELLKRSLPLEGKVAERRQRLARAIYDERSQHPGEPSA